MAKPVIMFTAVPYALNGKKGLRPQLEAQGGKYDLDFCVEVVNDKRLSMSPDELLHATMMLGEVAAKKVAEDGRPRGITKLIKWNRFAKGNLESPSSPWNDSCKAVIRAQLMADAEKRIDATFRNMTEGIGVALSNVTWIGAKSVLNILKVGMDFAANGNHMEWLEGDSATLTFDDTVIPLVCKESDVSRAVFAYPAELADVEPGTQLLFTMKSRGGVEDGEVYTSKKLVTVIAGEIPPVEPLVDIPEIGAKVMSVQPGASGEVRFGEKFRLVGEGLRRLAEGRGGIMSIDMTTDELTIEGDLEYDPDGRWIDVTLRNLEEIEAGEHTGNLNVNAEDAEGTSVGRSFTLTVVK